MQPAYRRPPDHAHGPSGKLHQPAEHDRPIARAHEAQITPCLSPGSAAGSLRRNLASDPRSGGQVHGAAKGPNRRQFILGMLPRSCKATEPAEIDVLALISDRTRKSRINRSCMSGSVKSVTSLAPKVARALS